MSGHLRRAQLALLALVGSLALIALALAVVVLLRGGRAPVASASATPTMSQPANVAAASGSPTTPSAVQSPSETPTPRPTPVGSWFGTDTRVYAAVFALDSTLYLSEWEPGAPRGAIHAIAPDGSEMAGWPIAVDGAASLLVDGDELVADVCPPAITGADPCSLHRFSASGVDVPGWPVTIDRNAMAKYSVTIPVRCFTPARAWVTTVVVECGADQGALLIAYDRFGATQPGWPVEVTGLREWGVTPAGDLYMTSVGDSNQVSVDLLVSDGRSMPGWPVTLADAGRYGTYGVVPRTGDSLLAWWMQGVTPDEICLDAQKTVFSVLDSAGQSVDGWPVTIDGFGSRPAVDGDGRVWDRMDGPRSMIVGLDSGGQQLAGWPVDVPPAGCVGPGGSARVELFGGDRLVLVQGSRVFLFNRDGTPAGGGPRVVGTPANGCQPSGCVPGVSNALSPVSSADGSLYLVTYAGDGPTAAAAVEGFDRNGGSLDGWPVAIPSLACFPSACNYAAPQVTDVLGAPDGRIAVIAQEGVFLVAPTG